MTLLLDLVASAAGAAIGLTGIIIWTYQRQWRRTRNGGRLIPAHVTLIGTSYALLSLVILVLVVRTTPDRITGVNAVLLGLVTAAFTVGDVALVLVLKFIRRRDRRVAGGHPGRRWYDRVHRHPEGDRP